MIQKILPAYGKVLIIDDKYEDVIPIQNILAEKEFHIFFMIIPFLRILK